MFVCWSQMGLEDDDDDNDESDPDDDYNPQSDVSIQ